METFLTASKSNQINKRRARGVCEPFCDMGDGMMRDPGGNKKGKVLFNNLLKMAEADNFDDKYLTTLVEYKKLYPESEKFDIFYGWYAAAYGNYQVALESALKAEQKRPLSF